MINPKSYMKLGTYPQDPMTKLFYYNLDNAINRDIIDFYIDTTNHILNDNNVSSPNLVFFQGLSNLPMAIMENDQHHFVAMMNELSNYVVKVNRIQIPYKLPPMPDRFTIVLIDSMIYDSVYQSITGLLRTKITKPIYYVTQNTNLSYTNIKAMLEVNLKGLL